MAGWAYNVEWRVYLGMTVADPLGTNDAVKHQADNQAARPTETDLTVKTLWYAGVGHYADILFE